VTQYTIARPTMTMSWNGMMYHSPRLGPKAYCTTAAAHLSLDSHPCSPARAAACSISCAWTEKGGDPLPGPARGSG
jgi:hypothetical protein